MKVRSGSDFDVQEPNGPSAAVRRWLIVAGLSGAWFLVLSIFSVWIYIRQVENGYWLSKYFEQHQQMDSVHRKLRLEWSRLQDPFLLETMGRDQFGLHPPRPEQRVVMR